MRIIYIFQFDHGACGKLVGANGHANHIHALEQSPSVREKCLLSAWSTGPQSTK